MAMQALQFSYELTTIECCKCFIVFAVPNRFEEEYRKSHEFFYCPKGHTQHFAQQSVIEKLRAQIDEKQRQLDLERQNRFALEDINKRLKRRVANGVCPCCKRTFANMARHMKSKHPGFK